jgi:hypothetical protein
VVDVSTSLLGQGEELLLLSFVILLRLHPDSVLMAFTLLWCARFLLDDLGLGILEGPPRLSSCESLKEEPIGLWFAHKSFCDFQATQPQSHSTSASVLTLLSLPPFIESLGKSSLPMLTLFWQTHCIRIIRDSQSLVGTEFRKVHIAKQFRSA